MKDHNTFKNVITVNKHKQYIKNNVQYAFFVFKLLSNNNCLNMQEVRKRRTAKLHPLESPFLAFSQSEHRNKLQNNINMKSRFQTIFS